MATVAVPVAPWLSVTVRVAVKLLWPSYRIALLLRDRYTGPTMDTSSTALPSAWNQTTTVV